MTKYPGSTIRVPFTEARAEVLTWCFKPAARITRCEHNTERYALGSYSSNSIKQNSNINAIYKTLY